MSFFEDLKKIVSEKAPVVKQKTGEVVDVVVKKTEQTVEIQKIKGQISTMERNNERDFKDIGKIVYEMFKKGEGADEAYIELCDAIAAREEVIAQSKQEIAKLKGLDVCEKCGKHLDSDAKFCQECGTKVDEESYEEVFEEEE